MLGLPGLWPWRGPAEDAGKSAAGNPPIRVGETGCSSSCGIWKRAFILAPEPSCRHRCLSTRMPTPLQLLWICTRANTAGRMVLRRRSPSLLLCEPCWKEFASVTPRASRLYARPSVVFLSNPLRVDPLRCRILYYHLHCPAVDGVLGLPPAVIFSKSS